MQTHRCEKGCCSIQICDYTPVQQHRRKKYKKSGVFIYDPKTDSVLLVQSRGKFWGPPKGTLEYGENDTVCAVREVREETGLEIDPTKFLRAVKIKNKAVYFYMEMDLCDVKIQNSIPGNDANGITWIKLECLKKCIHNGHIVLNQHCKILFHRFLDKTFPKSGFIKVSSRKPRRRRKSY